MNNGFVLDDSDSDKLYTSLTAAEQKEIQALINDGKYREAKKRLDEIIAAKQNKKPAE
jgi:hypothetical protein